MLRFLKRIFKPKRVKLQSDSGFIILNNVSIEEVKEKLEEFRKRYSEEESWKRIIVLYDGKSRGD